MEVSFGEMVFARNLLKEHKRSHSGVEHSRLRRAPNEKFFGVQIATNNIEEGLAAARIVAESGADFIDLNCGCPIYEATRRNLGSALLRKPERLAGLVEGLAAGSALPLSVKVRLAAMGGEVNIDEVAGLMYDAGAAALTIHGRTATDRCAKAADWARVRVSLTLALALTLTLALTLALALTLTLAPSLALSSYCKAADWGAISRVVADCQARGGGLPIIGNGDILTHGEARGRLAEAGVDAVMVGRGALIKPWIFDEYARGRAWEPSLHERVALYRQLTVYMKALGSGSGSGSGLGLGLAVYMKALLGDPSP